MVSGNVFNWRDKLVCPTCDAKGRLVKLVDINPNKDSNRGYLSTLVCGRCEYKWQLWQLPRIGGKDGYSVISVPDKGIVVEHRWTWERYFGPQPKGYIIHHINGIKTDSGRIENLALLPKRNHHAELVHRVMQKRIIQLEQEIKDLKTGRM